MKRYLMRVQFSTKGVTSFDNQPIKMKLRGQAAPLDEHNLICGIRMYILPVMPKSGATWFSL